MKKKMKDLRWSTIQWHFINPDTYVGKTFFLFMFFFLAKCVL